MASILRNKEIILVVTGGIAAYKSVELLMLLSGAGARVRVMMTASAAHFVGPLTFEALSGRPVFNDLWAWCFPAGSSRLRYLAAGRR